MKNLNICKNCIFWLPCGVFDNNDPYRVCTNEKTFKSLPTTLHESNKMLKGSNDEVALTHSGSKNVVTGQNFGCIHFEAKEQ